MKGRRGSKDAFNIGEAKLDENNYLIIELRVPQAGRDEGHQVCNVRVFTRKLYNKVDGKPVYLPPAEVRDDPTWIPTVNGFMVRESQARDVLPTVVAALQRVMDIWGVKDPSVEKKVEKRKGAK